MQRDARFDDEVRTTVDDHGREFIATKHRFPVNAAGFLLAPVLWMLYFVAVYSLQGAGCAAGLDDVGAVGSVDSLRVLLALLHAGLFLVATLWSGIPILMLEPCDALGTA